MIELAFPLQNFPKSILVIGVGKFEEMKNVPRHFPFAFLFSFQFVYQHCDPPFSFAVVSFGYSLTNQPLFRHPLLGHTRDLRIAQWPNRHTGTSQKLFTRFMSDSYEIRIDRCSRHSILFRRSVVTLANKSTAERGLQSRRFCPNRGSTFASISQDLLVSRPFGKPHF